MDVWRLSSRKAPRALYHGLDKVIVFFAWSLEFSIWTV